MARNGGRGGGQGGGGGRGGGGVTYIKKEEKWAAKITLGGGRLGTGQRAAHATSSPSRVPLTRRLTHLTCPCVVQQ